MRWRLRAGQLRLQASQVFSSVLMRSEQQQLLRKLCSAGVLARRRRVDKRSDNHLDLR